MKTPSKRVLERIQNDIERILHQHRLPYDCFEHICFTHIQKYRNYKEIVFGIDKALERNGVIINLDTLEARLNGRLETCSLAKKKSLKNSICVMGNDILCSLERVDTHAFLAETSPL
ncbi:MAG: hypothetical protein A3C80_01205 [Candidatus Ryanbacteria bacterium RIFCSPHIGHO2_02_FULL_45_43]|uniref:Uncharacterized protein n=1 Tax=Candidatus Ryanbacteria bacterium RIFCSPHIGHO2_01_45_13 TaxID=1802112 RepID=A0A1G2FXQ7_9BACT|nr:MAG: hypothetical protein A2718_03435 [Candidatus Ryanbacteria bacterium RIFCSPHIGHO2_01_FULL_44_130]OGZ42864.1 MAG: hypothetical protein A2W41_01940 [Candidatus Ryanbacteria bacterium RIFCSPHIGHO2_01_45_13]OGZ48142.1 MAG: hypothetical protein A3C80_01205 [Candidatus Ryanbacteria bacterium RIFCSPHIGHO2_02_FULL_45_43]OGZ49790.1 MAG: hypothetical protein A3E55_01030 [Candidatus Ryanbacteria bacterium RIFCSPHIGHO2_12_FULL_44_20]OGZ51216.1 MAG: hypothetical protein A3A17_04240 [Candidatus Ryanba